MRSPPFDTMTSSTCTPREYIGAPRSSSTTTGVGMGMTPCSVFTMPMPVGTDEEKTRARDAKLKQTEEDARMAKLYRQHVLKEEAGPELVQLGGIAPAPKQPVKPAEVSCDHGASRGRSTPEWR